jgi:hypothetical protein
VAELRPRHSPLRLARALALTGKPGSWCVVSLSHVIRHHRGHCVAPVHSSLSGTAVPPTHASNSWVGPRSARTYLCSCRVRLRTTGQRLTGRRVSAWPSDELAAICGHCEERCRSGSRSADAGVKPSACRKASARPGFGSVGRAGPRRCSTQPGGSRTPRTRRSPRPAPGTASL